MLIAWARGKKGRDFGGYEDEILSAVFGPLLYFSNEIQGMLFQAVLDKAFEDTAQKQLVNKSIKDCSIEFWPNLADDGRIEPDIIVEIVHNDNSRSLLVIEAKWNSKQHEDQLSAQWVAAKKKYPKHSVLHIFLTQEPHSFEEMEKMWSSTIEGHKDNLVSLTWSRLANAIGNSGSNDLLLAAWVKDVREFLTKLGQGSFVGMHRIFENHHVFAEDWKMTWNFQPKLMRVTELLENYSDWVPHWQISKKDRFNVTQK